MATVREDGRHCCYSCLAAFGSELAEYLCELADSGSELSEYLCELPDSGSELPADSVIFAQEKGSPVKNLFVDFYKNINNPSSDVFSSSSFLADVMALCLRARLLHKP